MGSVPLWYRVQKAAQYLGVAPWELEDRPLRYVFQAEAASRIEAAADASRNPQPEPEQ